MITMVENLISKDTNVIELKEQKHSLKELKKFLNIDEKTLSLWNHWYHLDGEWYYYKSGIPTYGFFNELVGVELAKYFDLDTIDYQIACQRLNINRNHPLYDDFPLYGYGLLSKNFRKQELEYLNPADLGYDSFKDLNIIELLRCDTEENYIELIKNIIKLTVLDFYMQQEDRFHRNILFSRDKNNYIRLSKIYDFEDSFAKLSLDYRNSLLLLNLENPETLEIIRTNFDFQEQFYNLMNINMQDVIDRIHDKYKLNIAKDFISIYFDHDKRVKKLMKEYQII